MGGGGHASTAGGWRLWLRVGGGRTTAVEGGGEEQVSEQGEKACNGRREVLQNVP